MGLLFWDQTNIVQPATLFGITPHCTGLDFSYRGRTSPRRWISSLRSCPSRLTRIGVGSPAAPCPFCGPRYTRLVSETTEREALGRRDRQGGRELHGLPRAHSRVVARWLGRIKAAGARVNAELELLDADVADRIAAAGDRISAGEFDDQFPIDVFPTGSGTSSNTNANEVIAALAGEGVHPNDHVNMGQSSNDVFPSAVHLAALGELTVTCCPRSKQLAESLGRKATSSTTSSIGAHAHDGCGPDDARRGFAGYAAQVRQGRARMRTPAAARSDPARRHRGRDGLNTHPEFARARSRAARRADRSYDLRSGRSVRGTGCRDALVETSGALKVVAVSLTKIANDLRLWAPGRGPGSPRSSCRSSRREARSCRGRSIRSSPRSSLRSPRR